MTVIDVSGLDHKTINESLRRADGECALLHCCGQRFIAAGMSDKKITIEGIPGNALGAYLNGASIVVNSNAQDQTGDTMNEGVIVIHGDVGDAAGYAMRGGRIFVRGNAGYRAGIHMKAYGAKSPAVVIGGRAGSFLGEYQAGGVIRSRARFGRAGARWRFPLHRYARRQDVSSNRSIDRSVSESGYGAARVRRGSCRAPKTAGRILRPVWTGPRRSYERAVYRRYARQSESLSANVRR